MVLDGAVIRKEMVGREVGVANGVVDEEGQATPARPTGSMPGDEREVRDGPWFGGRRQFGLLDGGNKD